MLEQAGPVVVDLSEDVSEVAQPGSSRPVFIDIDDNEHRGTTPQRAASHRTELGCIDLTRDKAPVDLTTTPPVRGGGSHVDGLIDLSHDDRMLMRNAGRANGEAKDGSGKQSRRSDVLSSVLAIFP
uniref:Uncharacterized protein n=2 Tax=Pyramimonas obovata TaxID=1411642 RepID=A0A7S0QY46_9CHLO